jgi:hypothetical protein
LVLRRYLSGLRLREWLLATVGGAIPAYLVGTSVGTYAGENLDFTLVPIAVLILGGLLYVSAIGSILGLTQWLVLRRYVGRAGWWVPANALAWIAGLTVGIAGPSLLEDWNSIAAVVVMGVSTGVLMGGLVGALTGIALVWLLSAPLSTGG